MAIIPNLSQVTTDTINGKALRVTLQDELLQVSFASSEFVEIFTNEVNLNANTSGDVFTYEVPAGKIFNLLNINASGENRAVYNIFMNADLKIKLRSYYTEYNVNQDLFGYRLSEGETLRVEVENKSNHNGSFKVTVIGDLLDA